MIRFLFAFFVWFFLLTAAAFCQHQFSRGLTWENNRYNSLPVKYSDVLSLPPAKSLKVFYPKVIIQPKEDLTGVAWGAVWNARTAAEAIACGETDPARILQMAFAPAYNYGLIRKGNDCREAISMIDLLESMVRNGTPYFSEFREFCVPEVTPDWYSVARSKRLSGYIKLYNTTDADEIKIQSVKNALINNSVVIAGMICPPSFQLAQEFWQPREEPNKEYGGHAVSIVSYDDTKFGGAFEVLNTWGKSWAIQGSTWVRYRDFTNFMPYTFSLFQVGSAACHAPFESEVLFHQVSGEQMKSVPEIVPGEYRFNKPYPTGTTFSISMKSNHPAYVYCFGVDPENTFFPLFPRVATTVPITFSELRAPDDQPTITLTDPPGQNSIYFIYSPSPVDLNKCMLALKGERNMMPATVEATLSKEKINEVKWSINKIGFEGTISSPVVIRVIIDQR